MYNWMEANTPNLKQKNVEHNKNERFLKLYIPSGPAKVWLVQ